MTGSCVHPDWATDPEHRTGKQIGHQGLGVSVCVLCVCLSVRAGSGRGHPSRWVCRESVACDHMVESVAPGQGQAKSFPQSVNQAERVSSDKNTHTRQRLNVPQEQNCYVYSAPFLLTAESLPIMIWFQLTTRAHHVSLSQVCVACQLRERQGRFDLTLSQAAVNTARQTIRQPSTLQQREKTETHVLGRISIKKPKCSTCVIQCEMCG